MAEIAIKINRLSKTFGAVKALDGLSLQVAAGEMIALIGASGSGKSTLLRNISGIVPGDNSHADGIVEVNGRVIQRGGRLTREARLARGDIGFVFQQFNLVERLSVLSNVLTGNLGRIPRWRGCLGLFRRQEKQRAMETLARVGIAGTAKQRASTLSGGQQQRAAIARTLVQGARVLLADEPIASLDPASSKRVMEILTRINQEDRITVLVSLHQVDYALRYCPRTVALRQGRVIYDGPSAALTPAFLRKLYGAESEDLGLFTEPEPRTRKQSTPVEHNAPALGGAVPVAAA